MELAAHQVVITISQLFFLMMQGLSFAISILVANSYGKKDYRGVKEYVRKGYLMMLTVSASLSVLLYVFRYPAAGVFTDSPEVASMAVSLFFFLFAYQFGDALQLCFANVLRGLHQSWSGNGNGIQKENLRCFPGREWIHREDSCSKSGS